jgi:GNAT superfamily N-acetyltransferase
MTIKFLGQNDVSDIARVHLVSFSGFFLSSLGLDFLKIYYSSCLKHKDVIALGLFDNSGDLLGFALGTSNAKNFHKKILVNNIYKFIESLIGLVIFKPGILVRLLFNLSKSPQSGDTQEYAELISIAVLPNLNGFGYGKILLNEFELSARKMGANKLALTTDYYNNLSVLNFYKSNKYEVYYDFITYPNRKMYKMIKFL